jgi:hypothetical protein
MLCAILKIADSLKIRPGYGIVISKTAEAALLLLFLTKETDQRETNEKNNQRTAFADHGAVRIAASITTRFGSRSSIWYCGSLRKCST